MASYCSNHTQYGCGHHKEHRESARKAWITRRGGLGAHDAYRGQAREDAGWFQEVYPDATDVHTHPKHRGKVTFKRKGKWYEMSTGEYRAIASVGRAAVKDRQRAEAASARIAERERKAGVKAATVDLHKREREIRSNYNWRVSMARIAEKEARSDWHAINAEFTKKGVRDEGARKIATYAKGSNRVRWVSKPTQEYLDLPDAWRSKKGWYTVGSARAHVSENIASGPENYGIDSALGTYSDFEDWIYNQQRSSEHYRATLSDLRDKRDEALSELRGGRSEAA